MRLRGILAQPHLLEPHLLDLLLEFAVLSSDPAQVKIVMPEIAAGTLNPDEAPLERGNCADRPKADQARFPLGPGLDLYGQPEHLQKQHAHKDDQIAIAAKDGFHNTSY